MSEAHLRAWRWRFVDEVSGGMKTPPLAACSRNQADSAFVQYTIMRRNTCVCRSVPRGAIYPLTYNALLTTIG